MRTIGIFVLIVAIVQGVKHEQNLQIELTSGNYSQDMKFVFNESTEYVLVFPTSESIYPYRVRVRSENATIRFPVLVVVRQEREVLSWQVPFSVETSTGTRIHFHNTSRTLCHNNMSTITKTKSSYRAKIKEVTQNFIVSLSTSSPYNVQVFIEVEEEKSFYLENEGQYSIAVSPSETRYYYYKFPNNKTDTMVLEISSNDDVCLTVSIQSSNCPVFDLDKDITYEGKFQTINRKGGMSIRRREYPDGFFLVFVTKADNYECSYKHSLFPHHRSLNPVADNRTSIVDFTVLKGINGKDYGVASLITLGCIAGFYVGAIILVLVFTKWGTISKFVKDRAQDEHDYVVPDEEVADPILTSQERKDLLLEENLTLDLLAKAPTKDRRRAYNYLWHILSIAIFYSIPVVQLVSTYQRVVNRTGDQDMCYYNFLCANPAWGLSDFNHIFSNVGYVFMGILFLCAVLYRHACIPNSTTGIPVHYGVFYAMGIALIIEGILSACYHICPTQSNYQFDTSFMYVMAVLCMVKLYQNRHPDINATAYATFTVLGIAIFLAMIGILNGSLEIWLIFVVVYSGLCAYISFKIYYISFVFDGFKNFKEHFQNSESKVKAIKPIKKGRFVLLLMANIVNYTILIAGLFLYNNGVTDFGTFLLGLLMANSVLYAIVYTGMKLNHGEKVCFEAIIYGLLGMAVWATATVFFLDNATLWTVSPAESRQWNQECILFGFYDKHDVWHLLSAPALYLTFMFLLCLDDDLVQKKRSDIDVF